MIGNATVVRVRKVFTERDAYGQPVDPTETRTTLDGCAVAPATTRLLGESEILERGRRGVTENLGLYVPLGTDLTFTDEVEVDGVLFQVDGIPGAYASPYGSRFGGLEVKLKRTQG